VVYILSMASKPTITSILIQPKSLLIGYTTNLNGGTLSGIQYAINGQSFVSASNAFSPVLITGLTENATVSVAIRIITDGGTSLASDASTVFLPNTYSALSATAIALANGTYTLTFTNTSSGELSYQYSQNGTTWSTTPPPDVLNTATTNAVAFVGNSYVSPSTIRFQITGNDFATTKLAPPSQVYNVSTSTETRKTMIIPTQISTALGVLLLPHNTQ